MTKDDYFVIGIVISKNPSVKRVLELFSKPYDIIGFYYTTGRLAFI